MHKFLSFLIAFFAMAHSLNATDTLKLATTTSTDNTGLLDYLAPSFKQDSGILLHWISTGSGKALKLGENCDVDAILVHSPDKEEKYVKDGFGIDRRAVMYNDFVIIGVQKYSAKFKDKNINEVFALIAEEKIPFASRGDNSGTHNKERAVWESVEINPEKKEWYIEVGQGMLKTIYLATQKSALTLTDRGTYIKYANNFKGNPPLKILTQGDEILKNPYSVMAVNPKNCPNVKYDLAKKFILWITGENAQKKIGEFKLLDKTLFTPDAK